MNYIHIAFLKLNVIYDQRDVVFVVALLDHAVVYLVQEEIHCLLGVFLLEIDDDVGYFVEFSVPQNTVGAEYQSLILPC